MSRRQVMNAGAVLAGAAALAGPLDAPAASAAPTGRNSKPTIVLVHGGYADSSCWNTSIAMLKAEGYTTICGSNPLRGITTDAP